MIEAVTEIKTVMQSVQSMTEENHRTLRGHNGTEGLVTKIGRMDEQLTAATKSLESVKSMSAKVQELSNYPTLTWLVRYRFKETAGITIFMTSLIVLFGAPAIDPELHRRLNLLIAQVISSLAGW